MQDCKKRNCYYCYMMAEKKPRPITVMQPMLAETKSKYHNNVTEQEFKDLFNNINEPYDVLMKLLPNRNRNCIQNLKTVYSRQFGWRWVNLRWVKE